jgi:signal peptidase I
MNNNQPTLEEVIQQGIKINVVAHGDSMKPLLDGKSDSVTLIKQSGKPKKGDLLLYRDYINRLVVHRVYSVDKKNNKYYMLGDSNITIEPPISDSEVLGKVCAICRKGTTFSVNNIVYRLYTFIWSHIIKHRKGVLFHLVPLRYSLKTSCEEAENQ